MSKRLGHAHDSITLDVYGHLNPSKQEEAAELKDELLTPINAENCTLFAPYKENLPEQPADMGELKRETPQI